MPAYEERIFSGWLTVILGAASAALFGLFLHQRLVGPVGTRSAPDWILLAIALLLLIIAVNFAILTVKITLHGISVSYGIIKHNVPWANVADCYEDEASTAQYGGFGIRLGLVNGRWRLVYNTVGNPRIVLQKRQGRIPEFVFSSRNPQIVIRAVRERLGQRG
jgi:hypothetical protein